MKTNQNILLVEDDANDLFAMRTAMNAAGLSELLHVAEDGQHAINYLAGMGKYGDREQFPLPDVVLLEVTLPGVMGLDVLRWIRQQPALDTVAIVILTASRQESDIRAAYRLRANSYLIKPRHPDELLAMVETIAQYWLGVNQPTAVAGAARLGHALQPQGSRFT